MINEWQSGSKILANLHVHGPKCMAVLTTSVTGAPKGWNGRRRGVFFLVITSIWDILKLLFLLCHRCFEIVCKKISYLISHQKWWWMTRKWAKKLFSRVSNVVLNDFGAVFSKNDRWGYKLSFTSHTMYNLNRLYNAMWVTHFFTAYDLMTALKRIKTFRFQRRLRPK